MYIDGSNYIENISTNKYIDTVKVHNEYTSTFVIESYDIVDGMEYYLNYSIGPV